MQLPRLIAKNSLRHPLRTVLTVICLAVAIMLFGLIKTVITAWNSGVEAANADRLITRNSASIIFPLPLSYRDQLQKMDGVSDVTYANWFGGIYIDPSNFMAQFAVDVDNYFDIFPEFLIPADQFEAFKKDRKGAVVGRKLADRYNWKIGDKIPLIGTIYPGDWDFDLVGIYTGKTPAIDETAFFMRWDYIDESMKQQMPGREGQVGWYALKLKDPTQAAEISATVDAKFKNSSYETLTETEKAFQQSFVQMSGTILALLSAVSWLVIGIILLVLINTMAMSARERTSEYAFMKSMGFRPYHLVGLITGESLFIAACGGAIGLVMLVLAVGVFRAGFSQWFPIFNISIGTLVLIVVIAFLTGLLASFFPVRRAIKMRIVDGLRVVD